ncbi:hypothetical protein [Parapedobacter lycopersici]|uniref:hypothetical protein n=1 Tax=Parapedobacter lycopersici TaxID=1864939 RepID=UPI00333FB6A0
METPTWRNNVTKKNDLPGAVLALIKDAWYSGCWIQDTETGSWYTPEEFKEQWQMYYVLSKKGDRDNSDRFKVRNPLMGDKELKRKMRDATAEYLAFRSKLDAYYDFALHRKKKLKT